MDEKIKISLPKNTLELLKKDCADFKFLKESGATNMNAFVNTLIANYYEDFSASEEALREEVSDALSVVPDFYRERVYQSVLKVFAKKGEAGEEKIPSAILSFKPTKVSEKALIYVEHILLSSESLSSFYRRLFLSYARKTKTDREKILHKENFLLLQRAIKKGVQVCLTTANQTFESAHIYAVSPAKEELFNYVLLYNGKQNVTLRLASVRTVSLLSQKSAISEKNRGFFDRQIACAPQYPIYSTDVEPIRVRLTKEGKKLFEKIYLYRPTPVSIDGDVYTFDCSANQLLYYFERFGENALILSPKKLGRFMRNYYYYALKTYKTIYQD